jgi:AcrR family transcriptional regulator
LLRHGYRRVSIDDVATAAGVGKGTVYLHWKTREALFWAVLQRDTVRLLGDLVHRLGEDPDLALPDRIMPVIYAAVMRRPLVKALLVNDAELLGALAADQEVAAGQRALGGNQDYLVLLARHSLLRDGLSTSDAGRVLARVMAGFLAGPDEDGDGDLLADVLARTLMTGPPHPPDAVAALAADVVGMFSKIVATMHQQLERAY